MELLWVIYYTIKDSLFTSHIERTLSPWHVNDLTTREIVLMIIIIILVNFMTTVQISVLLMVTLILLWITGHYWGILYFVLGMLLLITTWFFGNR